MKTSMSIRGLAVCLLIGAMGMAGRGAAQDASRAADAVFGRPGDTVVRQDSELDKRIRELERAVEGIEARLGRSIKQPSLTHNVERRMQDIEKRLDTIEREVKRLDERIRKVENRR